MLENYTLKRKHLNLLKNPILNATPLVNNLEASEKDKVEIPVTNFVFLRRAMHSSRSFQVEFVNISKI